MRAAAAADVKAATTAVAIKAPAQRVAAAVEEIDRLEGENSHFTSSFVDVRAASISTTTVVSVAAPPILPPNQTTKHETWRLDEVVADQPGGGHKPVQNNIHTAI